MHDDDYDIEWGHDASKADKTEVPVEYGTGLGSVKTKAFTYNGTTVLSTSSGRGSFAEGISTIASGNGSHAEGGSTTASGNGAHSEGSKTIASNTASHAEGKESQSIGLYSHAEGQNTSSGGTASHAEGSSTVASGSASHAEGLRSIASASNSHAEGADTIASGSASHAEGRSTIASGDFQHVQGIYNVESLTAFPDWVSGTQYNVGDVVIITFSDQSKSSYKCITANNDETLDLSKWVSYYRTTDIVHIVGNGSNNNDRSNAYALDWDGTGHFAGDVYVHANSDSTGGTKVATVADIPSVPVQDVQINSTSILDGNGVANIPVAGTSNVRLGTVWVNAGGRGIAVDNTGQLTIAKASDNNIKQGTNEYKPIVPVNEHSAAFYGLAKAAGDSTQSQSENAVGTYTTEAKAAIQSMLGVPALDANGKVLSSQLPSYVDDVLEYANLSAFPQTGESGKIYVALDTNKTYRWSGSAYVEISPSLALGETASTAYRGDYGAAAYAHGVTNKGNAFESGLYKITTNSEGHVTNAAAVQKSDLTNLGVADADDLSGYALKSDTVLDTTLSRGRAANTEVGMGSFAFGDSVTASGAYSHAEGRRTSAVHQGAHAEGLGTTAHYAAHAEGEDTIARGQWSHAEGCNSQAIGAASYAGGKNTIANGTASHVFGEVNVPDSYDNWPAWEANTEYSVGDRVTRVQTVNNESTTVGYICKEANSDSTFTIAHWNFDSNHMNYAEIVGNGTITEDPETHEEVRNGVNIRTLDWYGNEHLKGDLYVQDSANGAGGVKVATISDIPDTSIYATKADTVLINTLSKGRKDGTAIGVGSFAFGAQVEASGNQSVAIGNSVSATNIGAYAEGFQTIASGKYTHAEGLGTQAKAIYSHTEGYYTIASGGNSHIEGKYNVEDDLPEWISNTSYSIGDKVKITTTSNDVITVKLYYCIEANNDEVFTASKWQRTNEMNYVEIIGNGTADNARSNAYALDWDGNGHFAGDVYVGCNADSTGGTKLAKITDIPSIPVTDVQISSTSIVSNGVANIPLSKLNTIGVLRVQTDRGLGYMQDGVIQISSAAGVVKDGANIWRPIVPSIQHESTFYGLAKAAGDTTQSASENPVGTYTDGAKSAIRTMLGAGTPVDVQINSSSIVNNGVANIPIASANTLGAIKAQVGDYGVSISNTGELRIYSVFGSDCKNGTLDRRPITPAYQHEAAFYGLAKAAGDSTQKSSSNAVGAYTQSAKNAIHQMLGTADLIEVGFVEEVSGTTPTITGQANYRYVCGEVTSISITPPSAGSIDVLFTSGSSVAVLTVPNTVKWPVWFDPTSLDTDTIYELLITDGVYGSVMTWAAT